MTFGKVLSSTLRALALLAIALGANATPETAISFSPPSIPVGGTSTLAITINDTGSIGFTGGSISAAFDPNVVNTGVISLDTCGGTTVANAGVNSMSSTNMSLAPLGTCYIHIEVTSSVSGTYPLTIGPGNPTASTGSSVGSTSASLIVFAPIIVTNTNDSGAGSLRDAINTANMSCASVAAIDFNIPGPPFTISPATELPAINCGILVDGYSQPGSAMNTNATGANNAVIMIDLSGASCSGCDGLILGTNNVQVQGLAIHSFGGSGIRSSIEGGTNSIYGNYIGTDPGGMVAAGNGGPGITVAGGDASIGDGSAAGRNLVTANAGAGIVVINGAATITGNQIGGLSDASAGAGNGNHGIYLDAANYSSNDISDNLVIGNAGAGIAVTASTWSAVVYANESFGNSGLGLDFNDDGLSNANDDVSFPYDTDSVQNYPIITSVSQVGGATYVSGYLRSTATSTGTVFLYANSSAAGFNEGGRFLTAVGISTDGSGEASFGPVPIGGTWDNISAQAILSSCSEACFVRSSEYSPRTKATDPFVVTNTNDFGPGSLRAALDFAYQSCVPKRAAAGRGARLANAGPTITFNIPGGGVQTIQSLGPLPAIICSGTVIDGYTQPGASTNSLAVGDNANILVELDGLGETSNGLEIAAANVVIRGLSITGFSQSGILVSAPVGTTGIQVVGNFIGIKPDGVTARRNGTGVASLTGTGLSIGGSGSPAERNLISGNTTGIQLLSGDGSVIQGNYIGTDAAGMGAVPNFYGIQVGTTNTQIRNNLISGQSTRDGAGIALAGATGTSITGNIVGLAADKVTALPNWNGITLNASAFTGIGGRGASGNLISANVINGIYATSSPNATIEGNFIGTDATGTVARGNGTDGIIIDASSGSQVGGPGAGEGNVIAYNNQGVVVPSGTVLITGNSIFLNTNLGINLVSDGTFTVPANDSCDADTGGNDLANFPVLTAAVSSGGVLTVSGDFNGKPSTSFTLEFFSSPAGQGASNRGGKTYLGAQTIGTDSTCNTSFSLPIAVAPIGDEITATAIDTAGNTSSFSNAVVVTAPAAALLTLDKVSLAFGPTLAGTTSAPQVVRVTNIGGADATFSPLSTSGAFAISSTTCAATLVKGAFCDISIVFAPPPTALGALTGQLTITSNALSNPNVLPLSGTASAVAPPPAPIASLTPTSLTFASRTVSTTSPAQTVTLTNTGSATLTISSIAVSGDFAQANGCGASLAAGASCTINVTFTPTVAGTRTGTLSVTSNASGSPHTVPLSGTGVAASPAVSLAPTSLTFASRTVSTTSPAQTVTLANTGTAPLAISSIAISGDFSYASSCGPSVAAGGSCTIDVTFTPLVAGARTGSLTVTDNAAGSPHIVSLSGTGLSGAAAVMNIAPSLVVFGAQQVGGTSAQEIVTVSNSGTAPLTFASIGITGEFSLATPPGTSPPACPVTLAPGASCRIALVFHPTGLNQRKGVLSIATNAGTATLNVTGTGLAAQPPQLTMASTLDFGTQPVGVPSAGLSLEIRNTSPFIATLTELTVTGDFAVSDTCLTIEAGATCSPLLTFQPSALGPRAGTLTVRTLRDANPYTVNLTGVGEENRRPALEIAPLRLGFGNSFLGQLVTRNVVLRNSGLAPLTISGIAVAGDFFSDGGCIGSLVPGAACTVRVTFAAGVPGGRAGVMQITSNAPGSPHQVELSGTGCFLPTPTHARLGLLLCGS